MTFTNREIAGRHFDLSTCFCRVHGRRNLPLKEQKPKCGLVGTQGLSHFNLSYLSSFACSRWQVALQWVTVSSKPSQKYRRQSASFSSRFVAHSFPNFLSKQVLLIVFFYFNKNPWSLLTNFMENYFIRSPYRWFSLIWDLALVFFVLKFFFGKIIFGG